MQLSVIAFAVGMGFTVLLLAVLTARELDIHLLPKTNTQRGDSSLDPRSVDKLAVAAISSALFICLL